ncbi:MAG: SprT family zinc-dependent metalloprotease [Bacillota bacterium]|nr:SprT family zinc-dependent metalloprotease [Bacillota bacterium]
MIRSILLKNRLVTYELQRKRVKNLNLRIKSDMSIHVSASSRVSVAEIEAFMRRKEDYILRALDKFAEKGANQKTPLYESGELVRILGKDYVLSVKESGKNEVLAGENELVLCVKNVADLELKRRTLDKWLKVKCREAVEESCGRIYPAFAAQGIKMPEIRIRTMKSRWGSCMPQKGVLTFNTNLAAAPTECVDYVVAHEFTHFLHPDHSPRFYESLGRVMPDWKHLKKETNLHPIIRKEV